MKKSKDLPMHVQFFLPILAALRKLDGSGTPSEVRDVLIGMLNISEEELEDKLKTGVSRIDNQITWSKVYLTKSGLINTSDKNVWSLTEEGFKANLTEQDVLAIFKKIQGGFVAQRGKVKKVHKIDDETPPTEIPEYKKELLSTLQSLPPAGFERICQRVLRASGFKKVVVKGRTGDGGIDGEGILEVNPLVSLKVIFQAKRYKSAVSASQVRDFRGAMSGRTEQGIFITTGRFTQDAKNEAIREGAPTIELVDGDKLVELFEQKGLGLRKTVTYEIDQEFFEEYM